MRQRHRHWKRLLALAIGSVVLALFGPTVVQAVDPPTLESLSNTLSSNTTSLQYSIDTVWVLMSGFLVFFMQAGFAMLEAGLVRQTSVVNTLMENFIDAAVTILVWWAVGFGIAFGTSAGGMIGIDNFFLSNALTFSIPSAQNATNEFIFNTTPTIYASGAGGSSAAIPTLALFFFQFAFAATASTITTGSMAERTDFIGDLIYTAIMGAISYPIIAHWVWNSGGWIAKMGYHDYAGGTVVHTVGGVTALIGAYLLGPRPNRGPWGQPPLPHNLALATLGTMILWFGWYGFNSGSTLTTSNPGLMSLVTINTTLSAGAGAMSTLFYVFFRTGKWHMFCTLNGSLAGLVAITPACAFVAPWAAVLIGLTAGILVIVVVDIIEAAKIDDPVGAFGVHGSCGMMGTLAIGFLGQPQLTLTKKAGLFLGGGIDLLAVQLTGLLSVVVFTGAVAFVMFGLLKAMGRFRVHPKAEKIGIDLYEHGASLWPDILPIHKKLD